MADILGPSARVFCTLCICVHTYIILIKRITKKKKKFLTIFKCTKVSIIFVFAFCVFLNYYYPFSLLVRISLLFTLSFSLFPRTQVVRWHFSERLFFFFFLYVCRDTRRVFLLYSRFLAREGTRRCVLFAFFVIALVRSFEAGGGEEGRGGKGGEEKSRKVTRDTWARRAIIQSLVKKKGKKKCELYNI